MKLISSIFYPLKHLARGQDDCDATASNLAKNPFLTLPIITHHEFINSASGGSRYLLHLLDETDSVVEIDSLLSNYEANRKDLVDNELGALYRSIEEQKISRRIDSEELNEYEIRFSLGASNADYLLDAIAIIDSQIQLLHRIKYEMLSHSKSNIIRRKQERGWLKKFVERKALEMNLKQGRTVPEYKIEKIVTLLMEEGYFLPINATGSVRATLAKLGYSRPK